MSPVSLNVILHRLINFFSFLQNLIAMAKLDYGSFQEFVSMQWVKHHFERSTKVPESVLQFIDFFLKVRYVLLFIINKTRCECITNAKDLVKTNNCEIIFRMF